MQRKALISALALLTLPALASDWVYPNSIDDFGKALDLKARPSLSRARHRREMRAAKARDQSEGLPPLSRSPVKFSAPMLVAMKKSEKMPSRIMARCEAEMDDCFKDRLVRGDGLVKASAACRTEDVCLISLSLDYSEFTLVSRMVKATAKKPAGA